MPSNISALSVLTVTVIVFETAPVDVILIEPLPFVVALFINFMKIEVFVTVPVDGVNEIVVL